MNKNDLANLYLEYENDPIKSSQYFSALVCRYWRNVYKFFGSSRSTRLDLDDFSAWLVESIQIAFRYRSWKDPNDKLFNDPNGPDKVINRCIFSTRNRYYQLYNMDKRSLNYVTYSLDSSLEDMGDCAYANTFDIEDNDNTIKDDINCNLLIQNYLNQGKILEALIIDAICFQDAFKKEENKETNQTETSFSMRKLVAHLSHLNKGFLNYFANKYEIVKLNDVTDITDKLSKLDSKRLNKIIGSSLNCLKYDKELLKLYV